MNKFKPLIAIFLVLLIIWSVDLQEVAHLFARLNWTYIPPFLLLSVVMIWASSMKWSLFLSSYGHKVSILSLMRLYCMGYFFNSFLPSYVGGDIARSYKLGQKLNNKQAAFSSTFLERFTGLLAMSTLGMFFVLWGSSATHGIEQIVFIFGICSAIAFGGFFHAPTGNLLFSTVSFFIERIPVTVVSSVWNKRRQAIHDSLRICWNNPSLFILSLFWSLLFHALTVLNTWLAAQAIGWTSPDIAGLFVVLPLILIISIAPISPSGLGLQEGAFLFFLERIGASQAQGLAVALLLRLKVILIAVLGAVVWYIDKRYDSICDKDVTDSRCSVDSSLDYNN